LTKYSYVLKGNCWWMTVELNVIFFSCKITSIKNRCGPAPPSNDGENWILNEFDRTSVTRISCGVSGLPWD
jgi:hypothetical protein